MATIKSFSDLPQSKRLAEILPLESADMYYHYNTSVVKNYHEDIPNIIQLNNHFAFFNDDIPCWSLAALLKVIPKKIKDFNVLRIDISEKDFSIWYDEIGCGVNNELPDITNESAVDACYEMILKLHELNLL